MDVCFTNNPFAGAYTCKKKTDSVLSWDGYVDADKNFATMFRYTFERRPDGVRIVDTLPEDSYMVFRTRTEPDDSGNLVAAHYGVISGAWLLGSETMRVGDACFNMCANDVGIDDGYYLRKAVEGLDAK